MARTRHVFIRRPRPLITPRIEFQLAPRPELPIIAARIDFGERQIGRHISPVGVDGRPEARAGPSNVQSKKSKITKPQGEPGRPGSGGFTLDHELKKHGWSEEDIDKLMADVREQAQTRLDTSTTFRGQDAKAIEDICETMSGPDYWPVLSNYDNCWPVKSALKLSLKYTAEASRRSETKKVATKVRKALAEMAGREDI